MVLSSTGQDKEVRVGSGFGSDTISQKMNSISRFVNEPLTAHANDTNTVNFLLSNVVKKYEHVLAELLRSMK